MEWHAEGRHCRKLAVPAHRNHRAPEGGDGSFIGRRMLRGTKRIRHIGGAGVADSGKEMVMESVFWIRKSGCPYQS